MYVHEQVYLHVSDFCLYRFTGNTLREAYLSIFRSVISEILIHAVAIGIQYITVKLIQKQT